MIMEILMIDKINSQWILQTSSDIPSGIILKLNHSEEMQTKML